VVFFLVWPLIFFLLLNKGEIMYKTFCDECGCEIVNRGLNLGNFKWGVQVVVWT